MLPNLTYTNIMQPNLTFYSQWLWSTALFKMPQQQGYQLLECNAIQWVEIHKYFGGKYCLHIFSQALHPKDNNLHTRHHKNLTLSCYKFQLTTKAATGTSAKAAVNKSATGWQTNCFKQQHTNIFKTYLHPNLVKCNMSFISNCLDKATEHMVNRIVTQVHYVKCQSEINRLLK